MMTYRHRLGLGIVVFALIVSAGVAGAIEPLDLTFHRKSVRRFIFSNNIPLTKLAPSEIVAIDLMHPIGGETPAQYAIAGGRLEIGSPGKASDSGIYVGGITPYATYQIDLRSVSGGPAEVAFDFASMDRRNRVMVVLKYPAATDSAVLRLVKDGKIVSETPLYAGPAIEAPCTLRVQLGGCTVALFATKDGQTTYLGHTPDNRNFSAVWDFRSRAVATSSAFNVATKLPADGKVIIDGAESFLSAGVGQADIRNITRKDGAPYIEDGRLWFTFSARGLGIGSSCQGVMSLNPSVFDPKLEGIILFDRGDGLLRNDYSSHLFYDDDAKEWRAFNSCFSLPDRGPTGMAVATSKRDPRRGISVMKQKLFTGLNDRHEDPCVVFDPQAGRWRLLTTRLEGMRAMVFESANWDGPYALIGGPVERNSTGTLIQKIGDKRYVFSGSSDNTVYVYSYPDLKPLGELKMDLPPFTKQAGGRVWPNIVPLPAGYPSRYMALMMDRPNFPGVKGSNWSYGALYLYEAHVDDVSGHPYEFEPSR